MDSICGFKKSGKGSREGSEDEGYYGRASRRRIIILFCDEGTWVEVDGPSFWLDDAVLYVLTDLQLALYRNESSALDAPVDTAKIHS